MANILIIGASKGIGLEAAEQALACGHSVRAFARSADRITLTDHKLEKLNGDALNKEDVTSALKGIDAVIQTLGIALGPELLLGPVRLFSEATWILVSAMQAAGVKRLISITGFGAGDSRASIGFFQSIPFRLFLGRVYDDKDTQEFIIRRSNLDWVIVRPGILTKGARTGRYQVLQYDKSWRNGCISRADVADFLIKQIDDNTYLRNTPVLIY
ncbi:MAG: SDR family oxidoreductase [Alphaproteobacteria bacterium]|nr:SDR family oxidoreductase [Alphaproteobacteria bacterium]